MTNGNTKADVGVGSRVDVRQAQSEEDLDTIRELFGAYTTGLGIDLGFQSYAVELASLPGAYAESAGGALLLARDGGSGQVLGCMGVRRLPYGDDSGINNGKTGGRGTCEAKRLFVTPAGRGKGVGRALIEAGIAAARTAGYKEMKLDTLPTMEAAQALYRRFGFVETEPYYHNPNSGTAYMSLDLAQTHMNGG